MRNLVLAVAVLALGACSQELTERNVREFIDDADKAFLAGHASDICEMRSDDFKLTSTTFVLAPGRTVASLSEAEALDAERHESGERPSGKLETLNAKQFCMMAVESRVAFRRTKLVRTGLDIAVAPGGKQAVARAHYVVKAPMYAYGESSLSQRDQVEQQIGTMQTETDEESVITRNVGGKLVFASTTAVSKQFRVPKERDARL
jgi:hypothetical protein